MNNDNNRKTATQVTMEKEKYWLRRTLDNAVEEKKKWPAWALPVGDPELNVITKKIEDKMLNDILSGEFGGAKIEYPMPLYIGAPDSKFKELIDRYKDAFQVQNWLTAATNEFMPKVVNRPFLFNYSSADSPFTTHQSNGTFTSWKPSDKWWVLVAKLELPEWIFQNPQQFINVFKGNGNVFYLSGTMDYEEKENLPSGVHVHRIEFDGLNFIDKLGTNTKLL